MSSAMFMDMWRLKANKKYDWLKLVDAYQTVEMKKKLF